MRRLCLYLKDTEKRGHRAFLKKDKLIVNRQTYDLECLLKNTHPGIGSGVDTPADNRWEGMEEIS
jgi:hypothetical protein